MTFFCEIGHRFSRKLKYQASTGPRLFLWIFFLLFFYQGNSAFALQHQDNAMIVQPVDSGVKIYRGTTQTSPSELQVAKPAAQSQKSRRVPLRSVSTPPKNAHYFYRDIWQPTYQILRLNYCTLDGQECGLKVASRYCRMLGYDKADKQMIANNVGLTHFIHSKTKCKGWQCDGFKMIRCVGSIDHEPRKLYHYRQRRFAFPRMDHYRVAWCYQHGKNCGRQAADSFCRRLGYLKANDYKKQSQIAATKALGNQKLCFGKKCNGFEYITCHR